MKDLKMPNGISKIIRKSRLDDDLRLIFLSGFNKNNGTYLDRNNPKTDIDHAIIEMLKREKFDVNKRYIEYWYQSQTESDDLWPHVDFNEGLRIRLQTGEKIERHTLMSPITLACYLDIDDLHGGDLCISERSWLQYDYEPHPVEALREELAKYSHERYSPAQGDIVYFEGSNYYHWIDTVLSGSRKSMLINFWDEDSISLPT